MRKPMSFLYVIGLAAALGVPLSSAHGQATRTWVSGRGQDGGPCSRMAPCRTWAGAISKTAPGGEIDALDSGDFGALTITKSITLDGGGQVASVRVQGTSGIVIAAGSTDVVTLRNLRIDGLLGNGSNSSNPGINGIEVQTAQQVLIQNCSVFGFNTAGLNVLNTGAVSSINVKIQDSTFSNNVSGVLLQPSSGTTLKISINSSRMDENTGDGLTATGPGGPITVGMTNTSTSLNTGNGLNAVSNGGTVIVNIMGSNFDGNGLAGIKSNGSNGGSAAVVIGRSALTNNGSALNFINGGAIGTYGNAGAGTNQIIGPGGTGFSGGISLL